MTKLRENERTRGKRMSARAAAREDDDEDECVSGKKKLRVKFRPST